MDYLGVPGVGFPNEQFSYKVKLESKIKSIQIIAFYTPIGFRGKLSKYNYHHISISKKEENVATRS